MRFCFDSETNELEVIVNDNDTDTPEKGRLVTERLRKVARLLEGNQCIKLVTNTKGSVALAIAQVLRRTVPVVAVLDSKQTTDAAIKRFRVVYSSNPNMPKGSYIC